MERLDSSVNINDSSLYLSQNHIVSFVQSGMGFFQARTQQPPARVPWAEKYRPRSLEDVSAQDAIIGVLRKSLKSQNLPHMLFYGPPGTGKTSTVLALARELYGPELSKSRVLELNASDERGIAVVRDKIKNFARSVASTPTAAQREKYHCPNFKIIILDEADSMTQDAQAALRRTVEDYSKITRFCLICNYVTRIIDPLASRCSKFRFQELTPSAAQARLEYICKEEDVECRSEVLARLLSIANGDLRRAITLLQSASEIDKTVTLELINELNGTVPDSAVDQLISSIKAGVFRNLQQTVQDIVLDGWSISQLLSQLHDKLLLDLSISTAVKIAAALAFSEADRCLCDGSDEHLQLLSVASKISQALKTAQ